ncbi:MAG: esterase-like activity of phytase family protein, partial [Candidatus Thiodiazotropha sp. (ex Ctena orbiculata)]|nr:esterase-like activity of phytase family protein [Candidatus Thiodiazotropha taylori]
WINNDYFATADEGDLDGGSRGFTVFHRNGAVAWNSAATLDHMTVRFGHYPDGRSGNKGNEPENAEVGIFGDDRYLFVNSERSSLVFVYDAADPKNPVYKQTLPAGAGPEGGLAIPSRNLLVVASEEDNRGDKIRSVLNIYRYATGDSSYPTIRSDDRMDGTPIPWSALSGLTADPMNEAMVYAVEDSFYQQNRILAIDTSESPAIMTQEMRIMDSNDVMAGLSTVDVDDSLPDDDASRVDVFDDVDLSLMINTDKSINIDPEGIAKAADGGFWVVSEGSGTIGDENRPINSLNLLLKTDPNGVIEQAITLPQAINDMQLRFGFEGVTEYNGNAYVAFQRVWGGDTNVRIGVYDTSTETWSFLFYPLDAAESQDGGWVGLSDITSLGNGEFLVLERDNKGNLDAAVKRLYRIDVTGLADGATVTKTLVRDLIQSGDLSTGGMLTPEKLEGLAVMSNGDVMIVNDNDGVDDNSGETQLINLGGILD